MRTIRVKIAGAVEAGGPREIPLPAAEAHHVRDVLRLEPGAPVVVIDGAGTLWDAVLRDVASDAVIVALGPRRDEPIRTVPVIVAVALVKKGFDAVVRQLVELGVERVVPLLTAFTVRGLGARPDRWRRIADAAEKQSGRTAPLRIDPVRTIESLANEETRAARFTAHAAAPRPILAAAAGVDPPYEIVIGPEGGLAAAELELLERAGFAPVTLGPAILRTDTAAVAAAAVLGQAARERNPLTGRA